MSRRPLLYTLAGICGVTSAFLFVEGTYLFGPGATTACGVLTIATIALAVMGSRSTSDASSPAATEAFPARAPVSHRIAGAFALIGMIGALFVLCTYCWFLSTYLVD